LYNQRNRFYHNLGHLGNLFHLFDKHVAQAENPALLGFAIFYHDIVYDTLRNDNEEQSAAKAREHLSRLNFKTTLIEGVVALIMATKQHVADPAFSYQKDMALFLDLDLAVLAEDWNDYDLYRQSIRKEFNQYPEPIYKSGRRNALQQILHKEAIYYSPDFQETMEAKARQNLSRELSLL
jgi:predicted metal-dependent HD superfamily phosphohydrolase